jgi:DHA2 family methylenomycin A resistance protein-like MFS transporter
LTPSAAAFVLASPFSGRLAERVGSRLMTSGGVAIIRCGLLMIAATASTAGLEGAEIGLAPTGLGMGLATGPLMGAAVGAVPAARSGTAAALINVARMARATIGVAALGAVFALAGGVWADSAWRCWSAARSRSAPPQSPGGRRRHRPDRATSRLWALAQT